MTITIVVARRMSTGVSVHKAGKPSTEMRGREVGVKDQTETTGIEEMTKVATTKTEIGKLLN